MKFIIVFNNPYPANSPISAPIEAHRIVYDKDYVMLETSDRNIIALYHSKDILCVRPVNA